MKKKLFSSVTLLSLFAALLSGCGTAKTSSQESHQTSEPTAVQETKKPDAVLPLNVDVMDDFTSSLVRFIEACGYENQNYIISPASFRAALALAAAGADSDTKEELLSAMGFSDMEEMNRWYSSITASEDRFNLWLKNAIDAFEENREYYGDSAKAPDGAFSLENSVWRNTKSSGELSEAYKAYVKEHYNAVAENVSEDRITDAVNSWINENTNGLISKISNDLSASDLVLANTIYLRTAWMTEFDEYLTEEGAFTACDGRTVKKEFMYQRGEFAFYEDDETTLVCLPMQGGINALFILGDPENAMEKLRSASVETVDVTLPKFETETSLSGDELIRFCKARGAELAFLPEADFSGMSEEMKLYITDIIQKARIKTDEGGIEAAAATVVLMTEGAMPIEEEPVIKEFRADHPFRFILFTDSETPEPLFLGQIAE
ncbi:MAG: hypothetical protein IKF49_05815 [Clostridia bacterium]|nr:hypothetical protein [Clostridia bacterium]